MSDWQTEIVGTTPEAIVLDAQSNNVIGEFASHGSADAFIADLTDHEERVGLPRGDYRILPVRATPNGRDLR